MVDDRTPPRRRPGEAGALPVALAAALLGLAGCGSSALPRLAPAHRLSADDFRQPTAQTPDRDRPIPAYIPETPRAPRVAIRSLTEAEARGGVEGIDTSPGEPGGQPPPTGQIIPPPGQPTAAEAVEEIDPLDLTLVDAKVGDLNGLPVLARAWLEPMGARLRSESVRMSRADWREFAATEINERLVGDLRDELFLAEARSNLSPQQKAGLRVFLKRFEKDVIRGSYGSETLADEQLRRSSGQGLERARRDRERLALIQTQIREKVNDRVQVGDRDLRLAYERNYAKYNPAPEAVFVLIRVDTDQPEAVEAITEALKTTPFAEVATDERNTYPEPEVVRTIAEGYEQTQFFGPALLQEAALALTPGGSAGPIEVGSSVYWLTLDRINRETHSLYEVQRELRAQIVAERQGEEARRYLFRLFDRAGITGFDRLVLRLVAIAEQWYYEGGDR